MSSVAGKLDTPYGGAAEQRRDPLAHVVRLGHRAGQMGMGIGLVFALTSHASVLGMMSLFDTRRAIGQTSPVEYDIALPPEEVEKPRPAEKPPEPAPAPEPEAPPPSAPVIKENAPPKGAEPEPPPPPTQAAKVLTQEPDPEEPVDMTGQGFVTGNGAGPGYGMVSAAGTGSAPTYNKGASLDGKEGGKGTGPGPATPPAPEGPDLSKAPGLAGSSAWDCPFPPEADAEQIDQAVVSIVITVRADGTPQSVNVVNDPGYGFGRAARLCALSRRYTPALDRSGTPRVAATPPIRVRFTR
ncbi:energy transducer TonB [Polyangium sp. 15x6]|uniref:energy transducer TonB n=1 Tax=Polyangium sp. 15x6 TaxID=3042687 RepID=UPI00249C5E27|nr:energy transducer TonB [Polyangium sp. 15x6]MDI3288246.1 energy transducer TonB [Polyangium sp. 15x6]